MFLWGALSGACSFPDSWTSAEAVRDIGTNFYTYSDQSKGYALWALLVSDEALLGARRYRIPEPIHDFMLDKHNGFWARFQDRFTQNHYRRHYNPRYFYEDGKPYLSGSFVAAPEFNFVTNAFMNVAGGNHWEYDLKGDGLNGRIYDFWARPSAVIPGGHHLFTSSPGASEPDTHTGDWGNSDARRALMNRDILNMSSRGDEWWYGKNLGVYKNFTIGRDPAQVPVDPRHPLYQENGRTEFINEFQTIKFRFQQPFLGGPNNTSYYLVLGELLEKEALNGTYYFWEVIPSYRFSSLAAVKSMALSRNYGTGLLQGGQVDIVLTNGDVIGFVPGDYPIKQVISKGKPVPLNRFWYDARFPDANPLIEVFEVDRDFQFTGVRYAENPSSGVINIWNPFLNKGLTIDSSDYKNPRSQDLNAPIVNARADLAAEIMPAAGSWGTWYGPKFCPANQFAVGYRMRVEGNQGSGDDTSLNAVQLECKPLNGSGSSWISPHDGYWGTWTAAARCANSNPNALNNFLSGARLRVEPSQGSGDDTGANDATFLCSGGGVINPGGGRTFGAWSSDATCPVNTAVCGISSRIEGPTDDDTAMNGLRLMCCTLPAPVPDCRSSIQEPWTDSLGSEGSGWAAAWGDPMVDTVNHRLRLSNDDIVDRRSPLSGSYQVTYDLTLSGGTVFTPYVYVDGALLPSIRRAGNDMQFGGDRYGGEFWSDLDPAGFGGQRAAGVLSAKVTTYVKAEAKQMAMKVEAGGTTYRSGWTQAFTWPQTNTAMFRFVGQNNSAVYHGTDDYVYVGPLSGCAQYTDAEVDALYNR
jgi:hypothetical protein